MQTKASADQFYNPIWRISNLYTVLGKDGKAVPFRPWPEQLDFLTNIHSRNAILKARQRGMTTLACIMQLDDCLFTPNTRAAVIAHRMDDAKVIFRDKVKFVYDNLDEELRKRIPTTQDSADTLTLANNSSFRVSTSVRSGTLNWLHVSEFGKICAQFPEKAREIKTGSFPAAEQGVITVESTAEGEGGDFYDLTQKAILLENSNADLTRKDFRFFFYPWWRAKEYALARSNVPISPEDELYFQRISHEIMSIPFLAEHFDGFTQEQKNWWVTEEASLGGDMKREYPATPKEAFEQALEGAIFADDIAASYKHERIATFPVDPSRPIHIWYDLGMNDETAMLFGQDFGSQTRFVHYYENSGENIEHYAKYRVEWLKEHNCILGKEYWPHDGDRQDLFVPGGRLAVAAKLGMKPRIVERCADKWEAIMMGRRKFAQVCFDERGCKLFLAHAKRYRKEWDERRGVWRNHPFHGPESNGVDAYLCFAQSNHTPTHGKVPVRDKYRSRDEGSSNASEWAA